MQCCNLTSAFEAKNSMSIGPKYHEAKYFCLLTMQGPIPMVKMCSIVIIWYSYCSIVIGRKCEITIRLI